MLMVDDVTLSFDSIYYELLTQSSAPKKTGSHGKFKMAIGGVGWKEAASGLVVTIKVEEMKEALWIRGYHSGYSLFIDASTSAYKRHAFHGFNADAKEQIEGYFKKHYAHVSFSPISLDKRGWNWGELEVEDDSGRLVFYAGQEGDHDQKPTFVLPIQSVSNVAVTGRAELCVELHDPMISEIRFHVPGKTVIQSDDEDLEGLNEEQKMEKELLREQVDSANALCATIKSAAGLEEAGGEVIISLSDVSCLIPRGRYDVDFAASCIRLRGRTYDHRISYNNILKLIVVPKADDYHVLVILQLEPPLRHGQTRYPFLIFSLPKDEIIEVECVNHEVAKEKKLQERYDGPTFEVLSALIRQLAGQKILSPSTIKFNSSHLPCVRCTNKANEGHIYPMERALLYLPKPTILIPYSDIHSVHLSRAGSGYGNPRSFDISIIPKGSTKSGDLQFSGIPKEDLPVVTDLFSSKGIQVVDEAEHVKASKKRAKEKESEESAYEERGGEEEEESTDEEYKEGEDSSEEDVDEEYDEEYESDEEEDSVSEEE